MKFDTTSSDGASISVYNERGVKGVTQYDESAER